MAAQTNVDAERLARLIRDSTAWWKLAAERLEQGELEDAARFARLGEFGLDGIRRELDAEAGQ